MLLAGSKQLYPEAFVILLFVHFPPQIPIYKCFQRSGQASQNPTNSVARHLKVRKEVKNIRNPLPFGAFLEKNGK